MVAGDGRTTQHAANGLGWVVEVVSALLDKVLRRPLAALGEATEGGEGNGWGRFDFILARLTDVQI
jgi:hypothetical protein